MKLYEIADKFRHAMDSIEVDPETGEILNCEQLEKLAADFNDKAEAVACYIKELRADAQALKTEEQTLKLRRQSEERRIDSMTRYLSTFLDALGLDKIKTPRCAISFRKSQQVHITDLDLLLCNDAFLRIKQPEPDKTAIAAALKAGQAVSGAEMITVRNLQIK